MHLELPQDLIERVHQRTAASHGATEADIIRRALDSLDWHDQERNAILEGIDAWRNGDVQDFSEFDLEFRAKNQTPADS